MGLSVARQFQQEGLRNARKQWTGFSLPINCLTTLYLVQAPIENCFINNFCSDCKVG